MQPALIELPPDVERPMVVRRGDGRLDGFFLRDSGSPTPRLARIASRDDGHSWDEAPDVLTLPDTGGLWGGLEVLADAADEVQCFFMHDRGSGVFGAPLAGEGVAHEGPYRGKFPGHLAPQVARRRRGVDRAQADLGGLHRRVEQRDPAARRAHRAAVCIGHGPDLGAPGRYGAGRVQLRRRLPTPRWSIPTTRADSWRQGTRDIKSWAPIPAYGADEPVIIQKLDGRVWMLLRTQTGRLYESFSGRRRPVVRGPSNSTRVVRLTGRPGAPERRPLGTALELLPAVSLRLRRPPRAARGRLGRRRPDLARPPARCCAIPRRHDPPPTKGDFGTAYPFPVVTSDDAVIIVSGQGEGRVLMVRLDPGLAL